MLIPEELLANFDMVLQKEFRVYVTFTRESWHGRMRACRGVGRKLFEKASGVALERVLDQKP